MTKPELEFGRAAPTDAAAVAEAHADSMRALGFASHRPGGAQDGASLYGRGSAARQGLGSALWRLAETHARAQSAQMRKTLAGTA